MKKKKKKLSKVHVSLEKKDELYNTYHKLLLEKWIVKRSRFHTLKIISLEEVPIFATSHLLCCIEY